MRLTSNISIYAIILASTRSVLVFLKLAEQIGIPDAHFHDSLHTYAVTVLQAGDDIKTAQENFGHATAAFTLDTYAHATQHMKQASVSRMENYIKQII